MGRIEELAARYRAHIGAPWQRNLAGDQKAIVEYEEAKSTLEFKGTHTTPEGREARDAMAAARLLEPKSQRVHLTNGTLKTEKEVRTWLADTEKERLAKLKNGPLVVS